jgi:glutathione synthase/RimK-type ligase-like ATP-grasp enzyme
MNEYILFIIVFITIFFIFYLLNNLLKNKVYENYQGIITDNFYTELEKLGYTVDKTNKTIIYNDKTISYNKHFNSEISIKNAKNKIITSSILLENNIPIPQFLKIDFSDSSNIIYDKILKSNIKFPVVIKPINGTFGIDVMTDIETFEELDETISFLKTKYKDAILEQQISGDCYRVFVFNNKIIDVINREKPYIIGNGTHTVAQLIDIRNEEQDKLNLLRIKNVSDLYLKKQGFVLTDIPPENKKIFISNVINMHNGARIARIPIESIPQKNIDLFLKVNKAMNINCSGLDFLSDDITVEYDVNNAHILEVNGTPDTEIHQKIDGYNFFEKFVSSIF